MSDSNCECQQYFFLNMSKCEILFFRNCERLKKFTSRKETLN
jgi:hypothetical protein